MSERSLHGDAMGVALSDEQQMLVETCRRLVEANTPPPPPAEQRQPANQAATEALQAMGLWALRVGDELAAADGASRAGASTLDVALVVEELARGPLCAPFLGTQLAVELLIGTEGAAAAAELARLVAGVAGSLVLGDDLGGPASAGIAFDVVADSLAIGLDGTTVSKAELRDEIDGVDLTRGLARAAAGEPLGVLASPDVATRWHAFALTLVCADLVGAMTAALDAAVAHSIEREQFGRAIGSFQAVQHLCADQLVAIEASRSSMWQAAWSVDNLAPPEALGAARVAKAYCAEAGRTVCEGAIQVWGGLGVTWECPAHLFLRRALLSRQVLGDDGDQLIAIADDLLRTEVLA